MAGHSGFGSAETMRRVFQHTLGITPTTYRARFRTTAAPDGAKPRPHAVMERATADLPMLRTVVRARRTTSCWAPSTPGSPLARRAPARHPDRWDHRGVCRG
ncbi:MULTISPECIES: hypothetical protein [unclassified Streptomyces]|uniref:hypothetical protein n=1 Tax=unclassified Streptomyces TaxID=2593676 RepID=UPI002DD8F483|nr:hypothetical protein [Streptomyces sp. NBC_01760]